MAVSAHVRAAPAGLKVFINRYLDTENQLIPLFNLAERVLFCMLMCWPRATPSCEHLQKSGFNEFLTLLLLIHYLQVQYVRLIVRSRPLWIDRLTIEPSNSGPGSVLKS